MISSPYTFIQDLAGQIPEIPDDSILSRTLYTEDQFKAVLFGFAPGQELSEHTSSQAALLYFVQGEANLTLGNDEMKAGAGTWVHMAPRLAHRILAETPLIMLLILLKPKADS
ncbi:MAG TPA: cupin domain-containing protein [Anaerolineales bacterium]|jgi:quercetin dioxygenase-like cupin family protein|nr:cupin domain-containing protein [Anaerolineales bacterium]